MSEQRLSTAVVNATGDDALILRTQIARAHGLRRQFERARRMLRASYGCALELARTAELDELAIDAALMLAFVDVVPADQLKWGEAALGIALSSRQPRARAREASLRNNVGYALHRLGRYDEALSQVQQAPVIREEAPLMRPAAAPR